VIVAPTPIAVALMITPAGVLQQNLPAIQVIRARPTRLFHLRRAIQARRLAILPTLALVAEALVVVILVAEALQAIGNLPITVSLPKDK
jgi:hypothetical protein